LTQAKKKKRRRKSTFSLGDPFPLKLFEDYMKKWKRYSGGVIVCEPKKTKTRFDRIIFQSRVVGFFDRVWIMTAVWDCVTQGDMNELYAKVYRELKPMECRLYSKGIIRKRFYFAPEPILSKLEKVIPGFKISDSLSKALNRSKRVMELVRSVRPGSLTISLLSVPVMFQPFASQEAALLKGMASFYEEPESITWMVTLSKMFNRWIGIKKERDDIMRLLNTIHTVIRRKTMKAIRQIGQSSTP